MILAPPASGHPHALSRGRFRALFTADRPVWFNYHGYASELAGLLLGREAPHRMTVAGYREEGSTTTPFDMMLVNGVSRFDVAEWALRKGMEAEGADEARRKELVGMVEEVRGMRERVRKFIGEHGRDPDDIYDMPKFE
ncbi:hypothetical protein VTK26DRAFT_2110 [Humicola hyalothermophila]